MDLDERQQTSIFEKWRSNVEVGRWRRLGRGAALGLCVAVGARLFEEVSGSLPTWIIGCLVLAPFWLALVWLFVGKKSEDDSGPVMPWIERLGWAGLVLYGVFFVFFSMRTFPLPG